MSKSSFLIIFIVILFLAFVGYGVLSFLNKDNSNNSDERSILNLFPFGDSGANILPNLSNEEEEEGIYPAPAVREISRLAVSGFTASTSPEGEGVVYMERESGHIYSAPLALVTKVRLSNTSFPGAHETLWHKKEKKVLARYLSADLSSTLSFSATIKKESETTEGTLDGAFIEDNAYAMTLGPTNKLFALIREGEGVIGKISEFDGTKSSKVFSHPLYEWVPQWVKDSFILLTTKASGTANGYLYELNIQNGSLSKLLGPVTGMTTLANRSGSIILYSSGGQNFRLFTYNVKNKSSIELSPSTLSEKCAWKKDGISIVCGVPKNPPISLYPDSWYKGIVSLQDQIWEINTETGEGRVIVDPSATAGRDLDIINPKLSDDGRYFIFMDKNNLSLWAVRITE